MEVIVCDPIFDKERRKVMSTENQLPPQEQIQSKMKPWTDKGFDRIVRNDNVNHPSHYTNRKMEAIDIIEMIIETENNPKVAYNMSNVLKYILRFRDKGKPVEDLKKAQWYLNRMIEKISEEENRNER